MIAIVTRATAVQRRNLFQRFAVWLARREDGSGWLGLDNGWVALLFVIPCAFAGVPFGLPGLYTGIACGTILSFAVPAYGRRLSHGAQHVRRGRDREQVLRDLLRTCHQYVGDRASDVQLLIDAGTEREALLLIADEMHSAKIRPDFAAVNAVTQAASDLGLQGDPEVTAAIDGLAETQ